MLTLVFNKCPPRELHELEQYDVKLYTIPECNGFEKVNFGDLKRKIVFVVEEPEVAERLQVANISMEEVFQLLNAIRAHKQFIGR